MTPDINYRTPNYAAVFEARRQRAVNLEAALHPSNPGAEENRAALRTHYAANPWEFIADWGMTFEPRNIERGLSPHLPFVPWPRQIEFVKWLLARWRNGERGLAEKSRDCGVTWLSVGFDVCMWCFVDGYAAGYGSRKEELVDNRGDPKCIFEKVRYFINGLPWQLRPRGYDERLHAVHMRVINPETGASIVGEAGDNIGRGGRTSRYTVDEAAFVEHQEKVDAALSQATNCQIDISTPNGAGNAFYKKRQRLGNTDRVFIFDWRDDPRKDQAWYDKQVEELDEVIVAQEIDRDYNASQGDSFLPAKWVKACIDAHVVLGFEPMGIRGTGFDPADVGDAKAVVNRHGSVITEADAMDRGDITHAIPWAFQLADQARSDVLGFDADGMGAPSMKLALQARAVNRMKIVPYHGSASVADPDALYGEDRKRPPEQTGRRIEAADLRLKSNAEMFENYRAQTWTWVRDRAHATFQAVERAKRGQVVNVDPERLLSISSTCKKLHDLVAELSMPMREFTPNGRIKVESKAKMKDRGVSSPNLADAAVIAMSLRPALLDKKPERRQGRFKTHRVHDRGMGF